MKKIDLKAMTKAKLLKYAQRLGLRGISTMNKPELVEIIRRAKQGRALPLKKQAVLTAPKVGAVVKRRAMRKPTKAAAAAKSKGTGKLLATRTAAKPRSSVKRSGVPKQAMAAAVVAATGLAAHKFDVTTAKRLPQQVFKEENLGELPDAYGTGRLFLAARDPHYLFAYWDLSGQQMADYRRQSSDGRVVLRVFEKNHAAPVAELTLAHDARNWYIPAHKAATTYSAELGFWPPAGAFHVISRSREATTPPDSLAADTTARFATIPVDVNFAELLAIVRQHLTNGEPLAEALQQLQAMGLPFPFPVNVDKPAAWSPEQAAQVERILSGDVLQRVQVGSVELTEWLRRRLQGDTSSGLSSGFSPSGASWSGTPQKGFWFAVNAELIIYGATEPDAIVTVDGRPIQLRSDGTFSFHHTFPDGQYKLPIVAVSTKNGDQRAVDLKFERKTQTHGAVGQLGQPAHLKSPAAK